jgi:hypothetical protein
MQVVNVTMKMKESHVYMIGTLFVQNNIVSAGVDLITEQECAL